MIFLPLTLLANPSNGLNCDEVEGLIGCNSKSQAFVCTGQEMSGYTVKFKKWERDETLDAECKKAATKNLARCLDWRQDYQSCSEDHQRAQFIIQRCQKGPNFSGVCAKAREDMRNCLKMQQSDCHDRQRLTEAACRGNHCPSLEEVLGRSRLAFCDRVINYVDQLNCHP